MKTSLVSLQIAKLRFIQSNLLEFSEYAYEAIDGNLIRKIVRNIKGCAGHSHLDADGWRRILTFASFGDHNQSLCDSDKKNITDSALEPFLSCRRIPLDKNPELRPIGIGEILPRIFGRAVKRTFKVQIMVSAGPLQLCGL